VAVFISIFQRYSPKTLKSRDKILKTKKMKIIKTIFLVLLNTCFSYAQNWNEIIKVAASDRSTSDYFGYSIAISGEYAIVGAYQDGEDVTGKNSKSRAGSAYIYKITNGIWTQQQKIVASDRAFGDNFGMKVAISGNYAVVGAPFEDEDALGGNTASGAGSVYIFKQTNGIWTQQQKIVASDRATSDGFGSVAIDGDYIIVGASGNPKDILGGDIKINAGAAYIFKQTNGTWSQQQKIVATDRTEQVRFGNSVSISGDYILVGAWLDDNDASGANAKVESGSAYIFKQTNGIWSQQQKIVASDRSANDGFGTSVSISGNYAILGTNGESEDEIGGNTKLGAGSAYIFKLTNSIWTQQQKIVASDRASNDGFGGSVSISGDYAIAGAYLNNSDVLGVFAINGSGSAYIFKQANGIWTQQQKIVASDRAADDNFGISVAISNKYVCVGAYLDDAIGTNPNQGNAGSAYIFEFSLPTGYISDESTTKFPYSYVEEGLVRIVGLPSGTHVSLINMSGEEVSQTTANENITNLPVSITGLYLVRAGFFNSKVVVNK
jgi:hypothetical protein